MIKDAGEWNFPKSIPKEPYKIASQSASYWKNIPPRRPFFSSNSCQNCQETCLKSQCTDRSGKCGPTHLRATSNMRERSLSGEGFDAEKSGKLCRGSIPEGFESIVFSERFRNCEVKCWTFRKQGTVRQKGLAALALLVVLHLIVNMTSSTAESPNGAFWTFKNAPPNPQTQDLLPFGFHSSPQKTREKSPYQEEALPTNPPKTWQKAVGRHCKFHSSWKKKHSPNPWHADRPPEIWPSPARESGRWFFPKRSRGTEHLPTARHGGLSCLCIFSRMLVVLLVWLTKSSLHARCRRRRPQKIFRKDNPLESSACLENGGQILSPQNIHWFT